MELQLLEMNRIEYHVEHYLTKQV